MLVSIRRDGTTPVYQQIRDQILEKILRGDLKPGFRLPPERALARMLGVNRATVASAYDELRAGGVIDSRVGSGTRVVERKSQDDEAVQRPADPLPWRQLFSKEAARTQEPLLRDLIDLSKRKDVISFAAGIPAPELYPVDSMREIQNRVLRDHGESVLQHSPVEGHFPLREAISHLMADRGVICGPAEVLVLAGSQQGLNLAARLFVDPGDVILVEEPTYFGALQVFRSSGGRVVGVPLDDGGIRLDILETLLARYSPRLLYTVPTFQNPSGATMNLDRRLGLLELAYRHRLPILEDDPYGDLRYEGEPVPSLKSLDQSGHVIYLSTFSKILFPGLRMGWLVAPRAVVRQFTFLKQLIDLHSNNLAQWILDGFIREGLLDGHIRTVREEYRGRRNAMLEALRSRASHNNAAPGLTWNRSEGGFYLWCRLPEGIDASGLLPTAIEHGVAFVPGEAFCTGGQGHEFLRLNYSFTKPERIAEGVSRLFRAITAAERRDASRAALDSGTMPIV